VILNCDRITLTLWRTTAYATFDLLTLPRCALCGSLHFGLDQASISAVACTRDTAGGRSLGSPVPCTRREDRQRDGRSRRPWCRWSEILWTAGSRRVRRARRGGRAVRGGEGVDGGGARDARGERIAERRERVPARGERQRAGVGAIFVRLASALEAPIFGVGPSSKHPTKGGDRLRRGPRNRCCVSRGQPTS